MEYYIVSLKHTSKGDTALTFWGPNGSGYTWHRDRAGIYSEEEVEKCRSVDNIPVPTEKVDKWWMRALDFTDEYISVPNTPTVLHDLGLSSQLMKPKRSAGCRMTFINTPVQTK